MCVVTQTASNFDSNETVMDIDSFSSTNQDAYSKMSVTTDNLVQAQHVITLRKAITLAEKNEPEVSGTGYYFLDAILMRKYRPAEIVDEQEWAVYLQVVVPQAYRLKILELAHSKIARPLGINKTSDRILLIFFWLRLRKDVCNFIKNL